MTAPTLPPLAPRELVQERLLTIFPDGSPFRAYCTRDIAASTVFAMLYVGAVEGTGRYLSPKQVYRMSEDQAALTSDAERFDYAAAALKPGFKARGESWYADNTREPIRDETLRQGLIPATAVVERKGIATTANLPRYALDPAFAQLFDPALVGSALTAAIDAWRKTHLSAGALARAAVVRSGAAVDPEAYFVTFPNKERRQLTPGPSSIITKGVIEKFAPRFLRNPAVLWVSESGNKVVARDEVLARKLNLNIDPSKHLPDIILVDVGHSPTDLLIVFVEVVATDGQISEERRAQLLRIATEAGYEEDNVAFVTAFLERGKHAFRKSVADLAWNSYVWLASEPDSLMALFKADTEKGLPLNELVALSRKGE